MPSQNSDAESVIAGGLGSALGGVLTNLWGPYKSASASPTMENPPPGPVTAGFDPTLETIEDVEVPGAFSGERDREAGQLSFPNTSPPSVVENGVFPHQDNV